MNQTLHFLRRRFLLAGTLLTLLGSHRSQAQAANDDCAQAVPVTVTTTACSAPVNGTVEGATQAAAPGSFCSNTTTVANDVWYSFVPTSNSVQITLSPRFSAAMELRSGTCATSILLGCTSVATNNTAPRQYAGLTSGQTYLIRIYSSTTAPPAAGISSTFTLCVGAGATTPPVNDECTNAVPLTIAATCTAPVSGTLLLATQSLAPSASCRLTTTSANDVWYSFVATGTSQNLTTAAAVLLYFEVRQGTCASSSSVFCNAASPGQTVTINGLVNGQAYFMRLYAGFPLPATTDPNFTLCLTNGPALPPNDECSNAIPLLVTNNCLVPLTGTVAGATESVGPTAGCGSGTTSVANDVWYSFVANGNSQIINTTGGNFGAALDIRTGTCANSTSVFCGFFGSAALVPTGLTAGQTYFLRVYSISAYPPPPGGATFTLCLNTGPSASANDECSTAVAVAVVADCANSTNGTVYNATPSLPASASCGSATTSNDVWYSFVASGPTQAIALSTRFPAVLEIRSGTCASTTPVFCATRTALADAFIANGLTAGQSYFIRIYANGNTPTVTNAAFTLCLTQAPAPPANDECAAAVLVPVTATCAAPVSGTVAAASQSLPGASAGCGTGLAQDVWYRFVATATGHLITVNSASTLAVDVRSGTCASSTSYDCSLYGSVVPTRLVTGLTVGQTYYLRVYGGNFIQPSAAANFTLCITTPPTTAPANDECTGAIPLTINAVCTPVTGNVTAATQSLPPTPLCGGTGTVADVWYSFVAASSGQDITLGSALTNFVMEVRSGTCTTSSSLVCGTTLQLLQATGLTIGQTYFIRVHAPGFLPPPTGAAAVFTLCLTGAPANDDPCGAVNLPLSASGTPLQPITSTTTGATASTQPVVLPPTCNAPSAVRDVWFSFTPGAGVTSVRLVTTGPGASLLRLFTTTSCANGPLTQIGCSLAAGNVVLSGLTPGQRYYLAVSDNFFSSTSGPFTIAGASIVTAARTQADTKALVVYPNPSNTGQLTLRLNGTSSIGHASLLNALGQVVLYQTLPKGATEQVLVTQRLATGVYTLRVVVGAEALTRKVVLE